MDPHADKSDAKNASQSGKKDYYFSTAPLSRNITCRFLAVYHGPWIQMQLDMLEQLTHANFNAQGPRPAHSGLLLDIVKVRQLVDEASDLAIRAQNGTTPSALANFRSGRPGDRQRGGNTKLSAGLALRMREKAAGKLGQAYQIDEAATSMVTLQCASALDTLGSQVVLKAPHNANARYVRFFHEKISAGEMCSSTSAGDLDEIIAHCSHLAAVYRTRAIVKSSQEDYEGAVQDLTEALAQCKQEDVRILAERSHQLTLQSGDNDETCLGQSGKRECEREPAAKAAGPDQTSGLKMQLLYLRGSQYLELAYVYIAPALAGLKARQHQGEASAATDEDAFESISPVDCAETLDAEYEQGLEAREAMRKYAKKALRDYSSFFSQLDYACEPAATGLDKDECAAKPCPRSIYDVWSVISSSAPLSGVPAYPPPDTVDQAKQPLYTEMVTYHPFAVDAMHSFLLAHSLLQTSRAELLHRAYGVAHMTQLCDGYPFFVATPSPACAEWIGVLQRTDNFVGLAYNWPSLCRFPVRDDEQEMLARAGGASLPTPVAKTRSEIADSAASLPAAVAGVAQASSIIMDSILPQPKHSSSRSCRMPAPPPPPPPGLIAVLPSKAYEVMRQQEGNFAGSWRAKAVAAWINEAPEPSSVQPSTSRHASTGKHPPGVKTKHSRRARRARPSSHA